MSPTEALLQRYGAAYRWLATTTALIGSIAVVLSSTIVNVAIPDVMGAFGIDQVKAQALSTGFLAAVTTTMLLTDWCERRFGQRQTMNGALLLFTAGAILGGIAPDEDVLILARVIQGAAAGIVQPLSMIVIFRAFPPEKRGTAMGIFGVGVVLAPALGPWMGGVLIDLFDWRYVFYMGIPFALLGMALATLFLPERTDDEAPPPFDWLGLGLLCLFLATLLYALSHGQRMGWDSNPIVIQLIVAAAAGIGFLAWEARTERPMLDLRLFMNLPFVGAAMISFIMGAGIFGTTYLLPLFVQTVQGWTPSQAGLLFMPAGFALVVMFPIAGWLSDRLAPGILIGAGLAVFAYSSYLTAFVDMDTGFWLLAWWTILSRLGLGLVFPALSAGSLRVLPRELVAQGSGAMNFTRQLGGAFGVNLLAVILERRATFHGEGLTDGQTDANSLTMQLLHEVGRLMREAGIPDVQQLPAALLYLEQIIGRQAESLAFRDGFLITAIVFVSAFVPTWLLHRAQRRSGAA